VIVEALAVVTSSGDPTLRIRCGLVSCAQSMHEIGVWGQAYSESLISITHICKVPKTETSTSNRIVDSATPNHVLSLFPSWVPRS